MKTDKATALLQEGLAEQVRLAKEMEQAGRKVAAATRMMGAQRAVQPKDAVGMVAQAPRAFIDLDLGMVAVDEHWTAKEFIGAAARAAVRAACLGTITQEEAIAVIDRLDEVAEFEGGEITGTKVPYTGGAYRTGLIGYMLLRPWDAAPASIRDPDIRNTVGNAISAAYRFGDTDRLLTYVSENGKAPEIDLSGLVHRLMRPLADPDLHTRDGITLVAMATRNDWHYEVVKDLLDQGANPFIYDLNGDDAVSHAHRAGRTELVELLIERGEAIEAHRAERWRASLANEGPILA